MPKIRVQPKLEETPIPRKVAQFVKLPYHDDPIQLATMHPSKQLLLSILNDGRTTARRMKVRAKVHFITLDSKISQEIEGQVVRFYFGRPLPLSKLPRFTVPMPWVSMEPTERKFEADLAPRTDELFLRLVALEPLDRNGVMDYNKLSPEQKGQVFVQTPSDAMNARQAVIFLVANAGTYIQLPMESKDDLPFDFLLKIWIFGDNFKEISMIFHIQLTKSLDEIHFRQLDQSCKDYDRMEKLLWPLETK